MSHPDIVKYQIQEARLVDHITTLRSALADLLAAAERASAYNAITRGESLLNLTMGNARAALEKTK